VQFNGSLVSHVPSTRPAALSPCAWSPCAWSSCRAVTLLPAIDDAHAAHAAHDTHDTSDTGDVGSNRAIAITRPYVRHYSCPVSYAAAVASRRGVVCHGRPLASNLQLSQQATRRRCCHLQARPPRTAGRKLHVYQRLALYSEDWGVMWPACRASCELSTAQKTQCRADPRTHAYLEREQCRLQQTCHAARYADRPSH
jgi:hypothetical protein